MGGRRFCFQAVYMRQPANTTSLVNGLHVQPAALVYWKRRSSSRLLADFLGDGFENFRPLEPQCLLRRSITGLGAVNELLDLVQALGTDDDQRRF
jgi:hypothetical protein